MFVLCVTRASPDASKWDSLPLRLEPNLNRMLELFARHDVRCPLFWLGGAAERLPQLVRRCHELGHEVASHGQDHLLAYKAGPDRFREDVRQAKQTLEQITGAPVQGFRVPGFSFTEQTPWAYQVLAEEGYRYSSSIYPAARGHGGFAGAKPHRHTVETDAGPVEAFPITTEPKLRRLLERQRFETLAERLERADPPGRATPPPHGTSRGSDSYDRS